MVRFEKDRFIIEIVTKTNPIETWLETKKEMVRLLQDQAEEEPHKYYYYLNLLEGMMPDWETAKKMIHD